MFRNPFSGKDSFGQGMSQDFAKAKQGQFSVSGAGNAARKWFTGEAALDDLEEMSQGVRSEYTGQQYDPNRQSFEIAGIDDYRQRFAQGADSAGNRAAPAIATGPQDQWRQAQQQVAGSYGDVLAGRGDSLAQMQLQQGQNRVAAEQASQAASMRGVNPALAGYMASTNTANAQQGTNADAAMLRAREVEQARQGLAGLSGQARGQDIGLATNQAQMEMQQRQMNDAMVQQYMQMGMSMEQAQTAALMEMERIKAQQATSANQLNQATAEGNAQRAQDAKGGVLGAIGSAIGSLFSDERLKEGIDKSAGEREVETFLDTLEPAKYRYKSERHGTGDQVGIMAQDAERTTIGRMFTRDTPEGKVLIPEKGFGAVLASLAVLRRKQRALEQLVGARRG